MSRKIIIVGGVAGGASAAARARRCNEDAEIIMFERDHHVSFANCGLPYYIGEEIDSRDKILVATPELFEERFRIQIRTRQEVTAIDRDARQVSVLNRNTGETSTESYDKLILATGASPIIPPDCPVDLPNSFILRNLEDADQVKEFIDTKPDSRAVIVGAGFIGLEMAEQFHRRGVKTTVVEMAPQILPPLDPEFARMMELDLLENGIELHLGNGIKRIVQSGGVATAVELNDGTQVSADLVILGIGVRPNTELAQAADLAIGRMGGITTNQYLQTSDPDIYAVGDSIEYPHLVFDGPVRVPLAGPANRAGRIAGQHAATDCSPPMTPVAGTAGVRLFKKTAAITGLNSRLAAQLEIPCRSVIVQAGHHAGYFPGAKNIVLKLFYSPDGGKILGAQAIGEAGVDKRLDVIATCMRFGGTVMDLGGVDLSYAPPFGSAKDIVHMAAFAAENDLLDQPRIANPHDDISGLQVVDVRSAAELARFALPNATHIPLDALRDRLDELDSGRPIIAMCHSGKRAHVAARILNQSGFDDVSNLTGGLSIYRILHPEQIETAS